jgi:hypothetical protein
MMTSFTWKRPEELLTDEGRAAPHDLETRFVDKEDVDQEGVAAWNRLLSELSDPAAALATFLEATQGLQRPAAQRRVFISHRMGTAPWAERIAWLSSQHAGLEYWLDVHDPVLRLANTVLQPGDPRYAVAIAAIIEMALLNCTHVIAMHTPPPSGTSWRPSQWIPYELARAKGRSVYSTQAAGWFHPQVHPPESRGEYVLLADIRVSDAAVEQWLINHGNPNAKKPYLGKGTPIPPNRLP